MGTKTERGGGGSREEEGRVQEDVTRESRSQKTAGGTKTERGGGGGSEEEGRVGEEGTRES